jgi:hypothetical protein
MTLRRTGTIAALLLTAGLARAQDAAPPAPEPLPPALAELVADLGSPTVQKRIDAATRLASNQSITLKQIEDALKQPSLSPEQRKRLTTIAVRRFANKSHAGMGVGPEPDPARGVIIRTIQPDFPAAKVLRQGDRIINAGGETIDAWETLRAVIVSHDPGDEIPVTVVRDGATLNLTIKLGDFTDLRQRTPAVEENILIRAWELRSRPFQDAPPKPIPSGLSAAAWTQPAFDESELARQRIFDPDPSRTSVSAGGEARGGAPPVATQTMGIRSLNARIAPDAQPGADAAQVQVLVRLQALNQRRQDLNNEALVLQTQLNDPKTPVAARAQLQARFEAKVRDIRGIDQAMQALSQPQPIRRDR